MLAGEDPGASDGAQSPIVDASRRASRAAPVRGAPRATTGASSFLGWLLVGSGWSLAAGGAFNVVLVNLPFALLALPVLVWARSREVADGPPAPS